MGLGVSEGADEPRERGLLVLQCCLPHRSEVRVPLDVAGSRRVPLSLGGASGSRCRNTHEMLVPLRLSGKGGPAPSRPCSPAPLLLRRPQVVAFSFQLRPLQQHLEVLAVF